MGQAQGMQGIEVYNRQRRVRVPLEWLRQSAATALRFCRRQCRDGGFALHGIPEVEVSLVSDRTIARVHRDFLAVPGATDVITFAHGELVVSADTALANSWEHRTALGSELLLYMIHGMLHLNGFTDELPAEARRMRRVQERILGRCLRMHPPA